MVSTHLALCEYACLIICIISILLEMIGGISQLDGPNAVFMSSSLKYKILHLLRRELKEKGKMKIYHFRTHLITKLPPRLRNFSSLWRNSTSFRKN